MIQELRAIEIRNGAPAPLQDIFDEDLYELEDPTDEAQ